MTVSSMYLSDIQIPNPLPPGYSVFVPPMPRSGYSSVVLDKTEETYWVDDLRYDRLPEPPEGMVWVTRASGPLVGLHPALPEGEAYRVIPQAYGRHHLVVPSWCEHSQYLTQHQGPSARDCVRNCLYSDGCAACNRAAWVPCFGGGCDWNGARYRVPADLYPDGNCLCSRPCEGCGDIFSPGELTYVYGGDQVCERCIRNDYTECAHCSEIHPDTDIEYHESECAADCDRECCYSSSHGGIIQDYGYTPYLVFRGEGTYHLGLELELNTAYCSSTNRVAQAVVDHLGDLVYLKEDSSIGEGFEVVTHPMTFDHARHIDWSVLDTLRETYRVESSSDCGMHVHVSKTAFDTTSHTYRWMRFIYRNADSLQRLARRSGSSYASFHTYMNAWSIHYAIQSKKPLHVAGPDDAAWYLKTDGGIKRSDEIGHPWNTHRYAAINVENEKTFELRFFASTTRAVELLAALGFVEASIEYTRQLTAHKVVAQKGLDFGVFTSWVRDNNNDNRYTALISEIERLVG